jgi:carbon monoxide dehydrogenase subunit G
VRLENNFEVPVPVERAWQLLLDIERVAPCMPGATLTDYEGDSFAGTVKVKLGPVSLTYKGKGRFVERDEAAHRVVVTASGADSRGAGTAAAKVTAALVPAGSNTRVEVVTDLDITGKAAQFGRGLIGDVSSRLVGQFADCLAGKLGESEPAAAASEGGAAGAGPVPAAETAAPETAAPETAAPETAAPETAAPVAGKPVTGKPAAPPTTASGAEATTAPAERPAFRAPQQEAEAIDLLAVTGIGPVVRRAVPYVVTAAASFLVVLGVIWWVKRR